MEEEFDETPTEAEEGIKGRTRHLKQYAKMTDEEFELAWDAKMAGTHPLKEFEDRINRKLAEFERDYDLSDMTSNDKLQLRGLAQAFINLDDMEIFIYRLKRDGITSGNIGLLKDCSEIINKIKVDISKTQDDLKITRKGRKDSRENSAIELVENLKKKAKEFYEAKMTYIFCPTCGELLGTFWILYKNEERNKITLYCNKKLDNGEKCNTKVEFRPKQLKGKSSNREELLADNIK